MPRPRADRILPWMPAALAALAASWAWLTVDSGSSEIRIPIQLLLWAAPASGGVAAVRLARSGDRWGWGAVAFFALLLAPAYVASTDPAGEPGDGNERCSRHGVFPTLPDGGEEWIYAGAAWTYLAMAFVAVALALLSRRAARQGARLWAFAAPCPLLLAAALLFGDGCYGV